MKKSEFVISVFRDRLKFLMKLCTVVLLISFDSAAYNTLLAQQPQTREISGIVIDSKGQAVIGASVVVKGTTVGIITDIEGKFQVTVPAAASTLVISFIGMKPQEVDLAGRANISVQMADEIIGLEEVVIVGYGVQKRESVVAAITNTTEKELQKRGGVTNIASALAGQLPGVTILERSGEPGKEDPMILIRGQSTWNNASPLILVDGIERRMNDINVNEIQSISVLKDASATAVFGVRGANGVILITTKRGELGKAKLSVSFSNTIKAPSKITGVMESFSARNWKNVAIEHEVSTNESSWNYYTPYETLLRYKLPQSEEYKWLYPNVKWSELINKKFATDQNVNINLRGGTEFSKYFASLAYLHQGDIFQAAGKNQEGYEPKFTYDRLNFRANIDFQLTPTTTLSSNLSGYVGQKQQTSVGSEDIIRGLYFQAPDACIPRYPDGYYGRSPFALVNDNNNPLASMNEGGINRINTLFIGTDIKLEQKLDFIKGLSVGATISFDNTFGSWGPNIASDNYLADVIYKYIDPSILSAKTKADSSNAVVFIPVTVSQNFIQGHDVILKPWAVSNEKVSNTNRTLYYKLAINYARSFNKHDVSALFLFSRNRNASGENFPSFREDWVGRATYAYGGKYFAEVNGAYNGSEKFGPGYRFGFFPSIAAGWLISKEAFMHYDWLSKLKLRANIGKIGSDAGIPRWGYLSSWKTYNSYNDNAKFGNADGTIYYDAMKSPYNIYSEGTIANPVINWETAIKKNIGIEVSIFKDKFTLEADYFKDNRENIFMGASGRNIPVYFGAPAVPINVGKTVTKGMEVDVMYKNKFHNGLGYYIRSYITRSKDLVLLAEDPLLQADYLKTSGFAIGQTKTKQIASLGNSWNDVYAQTSLPNNIYKLPGDYDIIDFNGDGKIDNFDAMPYGYPDNRPMNTYGIFLGLDYKGFSFTIQFYGINNITRNFTLPSPDVAITSATPVSVLFGDYWTPEHTNAAFRSPRLLTNTSSPIGEYTLFDGSYLRLKTIELAYQLSEDLTRRLGLSNMRLFLNGNNLFLWSKLPEDTEYGSFGESLYPTFKQINIGVDVAF